MITLVTKTQVDKRLTMTKGMVGAWSCLRPIRYFHDSAAMGFLGGYDPVKL